MDGKETVACDNSSNDEAFRVGKLVLAIRAAINDPSLPNSLDTVVQLGTDSRYYVTVRGWLGEQLKADQSILDATKDDAPTKISDRIAFLKRAIRAIDLE